MKSNEDKSIRLYNGDCLEVMDKLIAEGVKVDAIITDPPYGTTACKWDSIIPFNDYVEILDKGKIHIEYEEESVLRYVKNGTPYYIAKQIFDRDKKMGMWSYLNKLIKPNGAIVLFGIEPFSSALRISNIKNYKYDWVWNKSRKTGHLQAKKRPMVKNELISVFYKKQPTYQPQGTVACYRTKKNTQGRKQSNIYGKVPTIDEHIQTFTNYPHTVLTIANEHNVGTHPTQKPVALMEYLIKTYTNENETVLDFTMGSGSTGVACKNLNRNFIGIELDKGYFDIAKKRIESVAK